MKQFFYVLLALTVLIISCNSGDDSKKPSDNAIDYFIKANLSSLEVKDATYTVKFNHKSSKEDYKTTIDFTLVRDKSTKLGFVAYFKTDEGEGLYDGKKYYYKSIAEKKVYISGEKLEPEVFLTNSWIINPITMIMLDKDYSKEINERKDDLFIIGDSKFDKYESFVIETIVKQDSSGTNKIRTYFDKETNLPVKEVKTFVMGQESVIQTLEIYDLKINKGIDASTLRLITPEGFAEEIIEPNQEAEAPSQGLAAPDFSLSDLDGKIVTLASLKGKVVLLDFWGTWCKWCVKAMPKLQAVHEHFKGKDVIVLGISCQEPPNANPKKFMQDNKVTYNSLLKGEEVARQFGVEGYPTLYVLGKDGKIISSKSGYSETMDKDLIELIEKNL